MAGRHLRRRFHREVAFLDQPLDELIEQLRELSLSFLVALATQRLEHVRRELPALDERIQDCLTQRLERAITVIAEVPSVVRLLILAAGKSRLQEEVGKLVEQRLEIDRVGHLRAELRVGVESHSASSRSIRVHALEVTVRRVSISTSRR